MTQTEFIIFAGLAAFICYSDMYKGIFICLMTGFFMDILRKWMPGEPVYLSAFVMIFALFTFAGIWIRGERTDYKQIHHWYPVLKKPLSLFFILVLIQTLAGYLRTQSLTIAGIGLLAYMAPIPAILLSYHFIRDNPFRLKRFLHFYILLVLIMVSGVYLSFMGYNWESLQPVGGGIKWYPSTGGVKLLLTGFFRSSSVAGWHAATAACLLVILSMATHKNGYKYAAGIGCLFLIGAIILTARRKFVVEIFIFLVFYISLLTWFKKESVKLVGFLLSTGLIAIILIGQTDFVAERAIDEIRPYVLRGQSLIMQEENTRYKSDTPADRLMTILYSTRWVYMTNGFFGSGAGTGSQGAQHFGGGAKITGGSAEGGFGKVLAELGVPGVILIFVLGLNGARYLWKIANYAAKQPLLIKHFTYGTVAFLGANISVFITAHQVFGDVFVLLMLGWLIGFLLAIPQLELRKRRRLKTPASVQKRYVYHDNRPSYGSSRQ